MTRHWTEDEDQREQFFNLTRSTFYRESRYHAAKYRIPQHGVDIEQEAQLQFLEKMSQASPAWPFDRDTPQEAADLAITKYRIRERVRCIAKKMGKLESRQAQLLQDVEQTSMPEDREKQLMAIAQRVTEISHETPGLTAGQQEMLRLEGCRRAGIDDLPEALFDEAARLAEVPPGKLRKHIQKKRIDVPERKAWSRAKKKVADKFKHGGLLSLLLISLAAASSDSGKIQPGEHSVALHQEPGSSVSASLHQGPGKPISASLHQRPGRSISASLHQKPDQ